MNKSNVVTRAAFILLLFLAGFFAIVSGLNHHIQIIGGTLVICGQALLFIWLLTRYATLQEAAGRLRHREALYAKIVSKAPIALSCADQDDNIIFNSEKFAELFGYTDAEIPTVGAWMAKVHPDEDIRSQAVQNWRTAIDKYKQEGIDTPVAIPRPITCCCSNGINIEVELTYVIDDEYRYAVFNDIPNRRAMEEELIKSKNLLSVALELAHLAPWEYDAERDLFEFGDEFYAIYATDTAKEGSFMSSKSYVREFVHPDDTWVVGAVIERVISTPASTTYQLEHRIIRRDGEVRDIVVRMKVLRNAAGKIVKWCGANQDITEYKRTENALRQKTEEIRHLAYTDTLTGLPNRAHLNEKLAVEMSKIHTEDAAGMVLFIDLDDLKIINETFGHTYGDAIIIEAGKRIKAVVGDDAFVGRVGGDEFLTIIPGLKDRRLMKWIAAKVTCVLCRDFEVFGEYFHMSASAGAAIYPADGDTAEEILKNADNAMYAAKNSGKNCWRFYDDAMQNAAYEKMLLTNSLRFAIQRQELFLYYQPQVRAADGVTVGFEALLRWHSPEYGTISPARFIPLAEQSKQVHAIGNWVLREACQFARRLADKGAEHIYVSVNVSPHQLSADGFIANVCNSLRDAGIQASQLVIEITENALISSLKESNLKLRELQSLGVRLALDDFGTGYSSLTYLQRLPVKTLKIDKSFTDMILLDGSHKAIIASIVDMAHAMEICVVAEGVETKEQIAYLTKCRCDLLQGYVISRPVPEVDVHPFLPRHP